MQAKLIRNCEGPNPAFDRTQPEGPDNSRSRQVPTGTLLEGRDCWIHCLPDPRGIVKAEPADDECRQRVAIEQAKRQQVLDRLDADGHARRQQLADKLPSLNEDGSNGPSPDTAKGKAKTRRRKAGQ